MSSTLEAKGLMKETGPDQSQFETWKTGPRYTSTLFETPSTSGSPHANLIHISSSELLHGLPSLPSTNPVLAVNTLQVIEDFATPDDFGDPTEWDRPASLSASTTAPSPF